MVNTRLEILGLDHATVTDIPISTNYVQADIREPDKRNATFTKTITLYGTSEVNKLFENIYEANVVTQTFNPNKKTAAKYFVNEIEVLRGDLQLLKIKLTNDNLITYECSILGSEGSLFVDIGEALIEDLNFDEYNHVYSRANQIASWVNAGTGLGYYYGFIHRGLNGGSDTEFNVKDFLPQFFAREYLLKMLTNLGYTFTSSILDSAEFKSLVVEPNISSLALSQAQINNAQFYAGMTVDQTVLSNSFVVGSFLDTSTLPFFDAGAQLKFPLKDYAIINQTGYYNIAVHTKFKTTITHTNPLVTYAKANFSRYTLIRENNIMIGNGIQNDGGLLTYTKGVDYFHIVEGATGERLTYAGKTIENAINYDGSTVIQYYNASNVLVTTGTGTVTMKAVSGVNGSTFYMLCTKKEVFEGNTISANSALPKKIKQKDFLKSIMQAYNLYIDIPDKAKPKELVIESYTDYFNDGIVDWENKIDYKKEISVNPISLLDGKKYIYGYKDDKDFYNTKYKNDYNEVFGTKQIDIENDFIKAEKKNELIFSATPNVANYGLGIAMPKIFQQDPTLGIKSVVPNIRLLFAGGTKQTVNPYTYRQSGLSDLITYDYGYCGHTDNAQSPTIDLNFGTPKEVYYTYIGASFTTNNLYNRFHRPFIITTTSRDSKVLIAYLWLTPSDINNFSFRKKYFIKDAYYIVNKIVNYNPMLSESTQCELIKVLDIATFSPTNILFTDSPTISTGASVERPTQNSSQRIGSSINLGTNCVAIGDGIFIPASAKNVTVIGNNVTVAEGVSNVSIINTNDYAVNDSNVSVNNGVISPTWQNDFSAIKNYTANTDVPFTAGTLAVDCTSGNKEFGLQSAASALTTDANGIKIGKKYTFIKTDVSGNTVTINAAGSELINGSLTKVLTAQYETVTIQSDGLTWYIIN